MENTKNLEIAGPASSGPAQKRIDAANSLFWNELCGTNVARTLGITDDSSESLRRFDDWYMEFYPYLREHIPFDAFAGKQVLEVGLGYGTVAQRIAESGAIYSGLDIAAGPVALVNRRISEVGGTGGAVQGNVLEAPFADQSFDFVVAIGSLHHTGALDQALGEVHRLLKPGGRASVMVYNAASYRQWLVNPLKTVRRVVGRPSRYVSHNEANERIRRIYDADAGGQSAPQTEFVTKNELSYLSRAFSLCEIKAENVGGEMQFNLLSRPTACRLFGPYLGLDLYCRLVK